jgi:hypothetical protein
MARTISQSTRDAITSPGSNIAFLTMLVIESDDLASPLYFVQNNVNITSTAYNGSQTYVAANFKTTLPNQEESSVQDATITISGINRQVIEAMRTVTDVPVIRTFLVRGDTPDTNELGPFIFKLSNVNYDVNSVSGSLIYEYTLRNNISTITVNSRNFPGLF